MAKGPNQIKVNYGSNEVIISGVEAANGTHITTDAEGTETNIVLLHTKCITAEKVVSRLARVR